MEDSSQSRVLEPIDSNSVSLISSSSTSNICTNLSERLSNTPFNRPVSPPLIGSDDSEGKWQFDRREFAFESNSTPSKSNDHKLQPRLHIRKRRSQLMGAKPRIPSKLHHTTSKLDLLDDNKLTTLPIPPPRGSAPRSLKAKRLKLNPVNEIRIHNDKENRRISYGAPKKSRNTREDVNDEDEEEQHPIVLIEDYIKYSDCAHELTARKKVSLADLKTKMSKRNDMHIPIKLRASKPDLIKTPSSSLTLTSHILEDHHRQDSSIFAIQGFDIDTLNECEDEIEMESSHISDSVRNVLDNIMRPTGQENDEYLSNLRFESVLKKCVVCDSPLYEISSLIGENEDFKEIVCGRCTEKYEEAAKIFENYEFETSAEVSIDSTASSFNSNIELPHSEINEPEEPDKHAYPPVLREKKDRFSQDLIRRLQIQSQINFNHMKSPTTAVDCPTMAWFVEAKKRIRWRWRVSGLLPRFLARHYIPEKVKPNL